MLRVDGAQFGSHFGRQPPGGDLLVDGHGLAPLYAGVQPRSRLHNVQVNLHQVNAVHLFELLNCLQINFNLKKMGMETSVSVQYSLYAHTGVYNPFP